MTLWTAADAAQATGGRATSDWNALGVSIDTRTLAPGDLFVALADVRDGHDFVAQALEKGAAAAMVSRIPDRVAPDAPLLIVDEVLPALERLGVAARARTGARVVGVTGSVGKTSTKEMLRAALAGQGRVHAAEKSYNNHWGVPLTLARMPADTDYAVIEIGMNAPGEIAPLARMARPHVAIVTTIAAAHLEAFGSVEGIAREKAAIFGALEPEGTAIFHGDLPTGILTELEGPARAAGGSVLRFGAGETCQYRLLDVRVADRVTAARAETPSGEVLFKLGSPGRHFALNGLAVLAAAQALGADLALAAVGLGGWSPPEGRGTLERLSLDPVEVDATVDLIDDAFNANPTSMACALDVLAATAPRDGIGRFSRGRRIAVLGDMLELGPTERQMHEGIAALDSLRSLDLVHCAGPRMRALYDLLPPDKRGQWAETAGELARGAARLVDAGDVVLVKGSKGSRVSLVVDAIRKLGHPQPTEPEDPA